MTLELWSDPATDGERSAAARRRPCTGARALAHRHGHPAPDARPARALPGRGRGRLRRGLRRGPHAQPVRALQRQRALRRDARAGRARSARRGSPPATTRASPATSTGRSMRAAADPRKDQSYMLARLEPGAARAALVPARGADQGRGARAGARGRPAGGRQAREPGPLLRRPGLGGRAFLRRHGAPAAAQRRARSSTRDGRVLGRHDGQHEFTVGQRRGLGVGARRAALRARQGRRHRPRDGRPARGAGRHARVRARATRAAPRRPAR